MILPIIAGLLMLLMTFALVLAATRPSREEKELTERIAGITKPAAGTGYTLGGPGRLLKEGRPLRFGWLERFLERYRFIQRLQSYILEADSAFTVGGVVMSVAALAAACFAVSYWFLPLIPLDLLAAALGASVPHMVLTVRRYRRIKAFNAALPDCIDLLARALRVGHSMVAAIEMVSLQAAEPAASEFAEVFTQQNYGLPLREALAQLIQRVPSQDLRVLVTGILVQRDTGGNLAELLDRIVAVIRERIRIQGEIRTETAQGRMTGWILGLLPVVMLIVINLVDPGYSRVLFEDPTGRKLLYVGLALLLTGGFFIRGIINGIEV